MFDALIGTFTFSYQKNRPPDQKEADSVVRQRYCSISVEKEPDTGAQ